jgi:hypothetical protein
VSAPGSRPGVARCSFLVLGEDSADDAHETLVALARKILRLVDGYYDPQHIRFEPPPQEGKGVRLLRGNLWKSNKPEDYEARRYLIGYIATKLLEGERTFVLYHIDGDRPWTERGESENVEKFRTFIETDVRQFVEHRRRQSGKPVTGGLSLSQLLLMVPFHSIEAWLFQSTELGRRLCQEKETCRGEHVGLFDDWERERWRLDEIMTPKKQVCFKSEHNHRLAESLDVDALYYVGKSFRDTADLFMKSAPLVEALAATRPG